MTRRKMLRRRGEGMPKVSQIFPAHKPIGEVRKVALRLQVTIFPFTFPPLLCRCDVSRIANVFGRSRGNRRQKGCLGQSHSARQCVHQRGDSHRRLQGMAEGVAGQCVGFGRRACCGILSGRLDSVSFRAWEMQGTAKKVSS